MKILLFYANAGHGHKQVAQVIAAEFKKRGLTDHEVKLFDALDFTPAFFRKSYPAVYQYAVKNIPGLWGWFYETLDKINFYRWLHPLRSLHNRLMALRLLDLVRKEKPDAILCTHFLSSEFFANARRKGEITAKVIAVITDFLPHTFWVTKGMDLYWVMGEEGARELEHRGIPESRIRAAGIPVAPVFRPKGIKNEIRAKWGFSPERLTLLMTSGSFGLGPQEQMLDALAPFKDRIQCFVVCGNNNGLKLILEKKNFPFSVKIFGFIDFMADLMEASDLIIAKSGGSTTTEALTKEVPMIVIDPIPGQETRNADVLKSRNAAFIMNQPAQLKTIIQAILNNPEILEAKKTEIRRLAKPEAAKDLVDWVLDEGTGRKPLPVPSS